MTLPIVKRYLIALDRHKLVAIASFVTVLGISGVVAILPAPPKIYTAEGKLSYNRPIAPFSTTGEQIQTQGQQLNKEVLLNESVIKLVSEQVKVPPKTLVKKADVASVMPKQDKAAGGGAKQSNTPLFFQVTYVDDNPKLAETAVAALMQAMVEQSRLINTTRTRSIIEAINKALPPVQKQLREAEDKLEKYIRTEGPGIVAAQDGTLQTGIISAQQQQRQIQMTLGGIETQMRSLEQKLGLTPEEAYTSSALSADPIIASLRSQILQNETQLEILRRDLREEHPTIIDLRKKQQAYEQLLQQRASEVIGGNGVAAPLPAQIRQNSSLDPARQQLAATLVSLQTQRDTLRQQLVATIQTEKQLRQEYAVLPNKQLEQARLQQQLQIQQTLYGKMQAALADAKQANLETVTSLSIAQLPRVKDDSKPKLSMVIALGAGAGVGLLVAGGLIFFLSTLDGTLHTLEEVRALLQQREVLVLGDLPWVNIFDPVTGENPILLQPDSIYAPFYERFRSNLRRSGDGTIKVVLFTSTEAGEGKTVSAYNLAIASALAGKRTLLIEGDLRSPSQSKLLKVAADPYISLEPLRYYGSSSEYIHLVPDIHNLYLIPSPGSQPQAAAILESSEMRRLLADVRGRFDLVVIDTPALSECNDALLLEPYSDGIILVTRPGYTQGNMLSEAIDQLTEAEVPLLGAIINGIEVPAALVAMSMGVASQTTEAAETTAAEKVAESAPRASIKL
jgi:capsular exopolysaccharide synthesis family protein